MNYYVKRLLSMLLVAAMAGAAWLMPVPDIADNAEAAAADSYFAGQLNDTYHREHNKDSYRYNPKVGSIAKVFYDALDEMYKSGELKTGKAVRTLTDNNMISQEDAESYTNGNPTLLYAMSAGRDAFYADHPEIFYVNFDNISFVITLSGDGKYKLTFGTGRTLSYLRPGFETAQSIETAQNEMEAKADEIIAEANEYADEALVNSGMEADGAGTAKNDSDPNIYEMDELIDSNDELESSRVKTRDEYLVRFVHDNLIRNTSYRLENNCSDGNEENIRTPYGALVKHESLCEGYSRAFKYILDKLNIPCILVNGVYMHTNDIAEPHMWNYVQIDGKWYAVDTTFDDPIVSNPVNANGVDGQESTEYLLVGEDNMNRKHITSGIWSANEYNFSYPALNACSLGYKDVFSSGGLNVQYCPDMAFWGMNEYEGTGAFRVSYEGMGYSTAASKGKYILAKFYQPSLENENQYVDSGWVYADVSAYNIKDIQDESTGWTVFPAPHISMMEFAVTDIPPRGVTDPNDPNFTGENYDIHFYGDPVSLEYQTDMLHNPNGTYVAPPYIKTASPALTGRVYIDDGTKDVTVVYDQPLVKIDKSKPAGFDLRAEDPLEGSSADIILDDTIVKNFKWDGDRTVTFKFTPKKDFANDSVTYFISLTNLQGKISQKIPNEISYFASYRCASCSLKASMGCDWNVFGKPQLLENSDILSKAENWQSNEGSLDASDNKISHRLALVASDTTPSTAEKMNDALMDPDMHSDGSLPPETLATDTYNIRLTLCKKQIVKTGEKVRVRVGFPKGYGPDDAGVTFKAYHFITNDAGEITGVEEIPCEITKYGLIIWCDAFSPFTIAAVKGETPSSTDKTAFISNSSGGSVTYDSAGASDMNGMLKLAENESRTLTVTPDSGYVIESVCIGKKPIDVSDSERNGKSLDINYDEIENGAVVNVSFTQKDVYDEKLNSLGEGEVLISPMISEPFSVSFGSPSKTTDGLSLPVTVSGDGSCEAVFYVAEYDDNTLSGVRAIRSEIISDSRDIDIPCTLSNDCKAKLFVWDGNLKPLASSSFNLE